MARAQAAAAAPIDPLDALVRLGKALGDSLRASVLQALHQESYAVGELCTLFDVAQPALSHHLKILREAGLVAVRREGNSVFYRRAPVEPDSHAAAFLDALDRVPLDDTLARRVEAVHSERNRRSAEFFARNATEIRARQAEICEPACYADVVLEMLLSAVSAGLNTGRALEVGPGDGRLLSRLAASFKEVTGIDNSRSMLKAARAALAGSEEVSLKHRDFLTLPPRPRYDAVIAAMVLHHQASPASFLAHAAKILKPAGTLVVAELTRHDQQWAAEACGDQWLGFEPEELCGWAARAGLELVQSQYLAQKNGFRVQVHRFGNDRVQPINRSTTGNTP